jgi:hypothetical protein
MFFTRTIEITGTAPIGERQKKKFLQGSIPAGARSRNCLNGYLSVTKRGNPRTVSTALN